MNQSEVSSLADNTTLLLASRLIQLIGIPTMLALCGWLLLSMNEMQGSVIRLETLVSERTQDRYTATDAKHDFAVVNVKEDDLNRQISENSRRIGVLEDINFKAAAARR